MSGPVLLLELGPSMASMAAQLAALGHELLIDNPELRRTLNEMQVATEDAGRDDPEDQHAAVTSAVAPMLELASRLLAEKSASLPFHSGRPGIASRDLASVAIGRLGTTLPAAVAAKLRIEALIRERRPALIVLGNLSTAPQRVVAQVAARERIPCLELAHGIYGGTPVHVAGDHHRLHAPYAAFGARAKRRLVALGNRPEQIFVTGSPAFDPLFQGTAPNATAAAKQALGLDPGRLCLLHFATYADLRTPHWAAASARLLRIAETVVQAAGRLADRLQLVVRPHPTEATQATPEARVRLEQSFRTWVAARGVENVVLAQGPVVEALQAADIVVTTPSTVICEAMILGKPVVVVPRIPGGDDFFTAADGIVFVDEIESLPEAFEQLTTSATRRDEVVAAQHAALPDLHHGHDGNASGRVAALLDALATGGLAVDAATVGAGER